MGEENMPKYDRDKARLVHEETGEEIMPGSVVPDFRGNDTRFDFISILPSPGKSGKIICGDREYYPGVLNARIEIMN
jgi:hypothetical protein